ncbi:hypothetical protein EAF00_000108 [Botryotinia globosa]|nr:hypothetical protein EAF00_000108 [Botryotinia globosa]
MDVLGTPQRQVINRVIDSLRIVLRTSNFSLVPRVPLAPQVPPVPPVPLVLPVRSSISSKSSNPNSHPLTYSLVQQKGTYTYTYIPRYRYPDIDTRYQIPDTQATQAIQ